MALYLIKFKQPNLTANKHGVVQTQLTWPRNYAVLLVPQWKLIDSVVNSFHYSMVLKNNYIIAILNRQNVNRILIWDLCPLRLSVAVHDHYLLSTWPPALNFPRGISRKWSRIYRSCRQLAVTVEHEFHISHEFWTHFLIFG